MAYNGSGVFNRIHSWAQDAANSLNISSSRMDAEMDGFATGLSTALTKDGQTPATANLPMGGFIHTGVGKGTTRTHYVNVEQIQDAELTYFADSGSANTYAITPSPSIAAYATGQMFWVKIGNLNTGASTLNVNAIGTKAIQKHGAALIGGELLANAVVGMVYDGTAFQMLSSVVAGTAVNIAATATETTVDGAADSVLMYDSSATANREVLIDNLPTNIAGTTTETTVDGAADSVLMYDDSASANREVLVDNIRTPVASNAEMETATATDRVVTPGRQHRHPGAPKAWGYITVTSSTPAVGASYGLDGSTPVADQAAGHVRIKLATAMSSTSYCVVAQAAALGNYTCPAVIIDADEFDIQIRNSATGALVDDIALSFTVFGDHA